MIDSESHTLLVRVWLLGEFYVERKNDDGTWEAVEKTAWEGSYARPLFQRLLCATSRRASRSNILDELWPNTPSHLAEKYLNNASSKLRQIFHKEVVKSLGSHGIGGYQLAGQSMLWTDIDACEFFMTEAERLGLPSAKSLLLLEQAAQHFERGEMLEGESGQWCLALRIQQETALRYCRILLAEGYEEHNLVWHAKSQYQKLLETNAADEDTLCRLLAFFHRHGMISDALQYYQQAQQHFEEQGLPLSTTARTLIKKLTNEPPSLALYITDHSTTREQYTFSSSIRTAQESSQPHQVFVPPETEGTIHPFTLQAYEDTLTLAWEAFYTSNAQHSASAVNHWLLFLKQQAHAAKTDTSRKQILMFLCRFLQLASVLARDRTDFHYAFLAIHEAMTIAFQLEDAELMASSLYRRAKLYVAQRHYELAVLDLEAAIPYAHRSRNPLRCYISMFLAEVYSLFASGNEEFFQKSLDHLDNVSQSVHKEGVLEGDGSFVKVDVSGLFMIRGDVLRRYGEMQQAHDALVLVRESLPKEFTRWQGNLHLSTAQLFLAEGDISNSCRQIHHALDIFQATSSRSGLAKTHRLYRAVQTGEPERSEVKELEMRLSTLESRLKENR